MTTRTVEQVGNWESRSFSGGYRGLQELSDERFSGIVTAGPTRLCMTKGKVVGVLEGDIEDFEDASGTVHEAPSPALPLLAVMQERSDEVRAQYYTEETPVSEVDQTLTDGNFTGYVELSENVLSGDYYIVYHQGRSMNVAWVGESQQLLIEDEAFERTQGEVGIYKVRPADIDVIEIPEPATPPSDDTGPIETATTDAETSDAADSSDEAAAEPTEEPDTETVDSDESSSTPGAAAGDSHAAESSAAPSGDGADGATANRAHQEATREQSQPASSTPSSASQSPDSERTASQGRDPQPQERERGQRPQQGHSHREPQPSQNGGQTSGPAEASPSGNGGDTRQRDAASAPTPTEAVGGLETRSIPSLDPGRTKTASDDGSSSPTPDPQPDRPAPGGRPAEASHQRGAQQPTRSSRQQPQDSAPQQPAGPSPATQPSEGSQQTGRQRDQHAGSADAATASSDQGDLEAELQEREDEIERLEAELESVEGERDDLEAQLDEVKAERDELQDRVEQLERRVSELRSDDGGESIADRRRMSPGEVIDGTNLFVRYQSKGDATLESAYRGNAEPTAVNDNLDIQHHTQFDAEDVAVNGEPFTEFLHGTLQYKFVEWTTRVLPYEIRDTGHEGGLSDLYQALPEIDRAELNGTISVVYEEEGQEQRSQETFDVVLRDRMGNPLVVANMNESRQPASQSMMESLITASNRVGESKESLAGSFLVTSSFFDPEAMEAAKDATGSGLLSRDKRESFVKLSRKEGFHLCLVQYLDGQFELSVPEL
ncbi:hypothetical protein ACFR9U_09555 [Halorientalis brevis]|uniref:DUF7527 domain-containing protein n=1 Tax=Halorientalis brevis TaxID=1126241 RepID=A0ABD6CB52_9EURY